MSMRKESGEMTSNREVFFFKYAQISTSHSIPKTVPIQESTMKSSPDTEEISDFTEEEVERAIKRMERHKSQGIGGITSDIIKLGGQIVLTHQTNILKTMLRQSRFLTVGMKQK